MGRGRAVEEKPRWRARLGFSRPGEDRGRWDARHRQGALGALRGLARAAPFRIVTLGELQQASPGKGVRSVCEVAHALCKPLKNSCSISRAWRCRFSGNSAPARGRRQGSIIVSHLMLILLETGSPAGLTFDRATVPPSRTKASERARSRPPRHGRATPFQERPA